MRWMRNVVAWIAAVVVAAMAGSIVQTQFNLAMIRDLGAPAPWNLRLETTLHDLIHFAPTYGLLVAAAFLIALAVSGLLARRWPRARAPLHTLAAGTGIAAALLLMNWILPATVIGAARFGTGILALALAGALGGLLFARWTQPREP
nr:hypothetical protein [Thioalkalivibrio sp.]